MRIDGLAVVLASVRPAPGVQIRADVRGGPFGVYDAVSALL
jgi:hypothetical protein